jgi:hypothetical protein
MVADVYLLKKYAQQGAGSETGTTDGSVVKA